MGATNCAERVCYKSSSSSPPKKKRPSASKIKSPEEVRVQRRRLSVSASQVGDITRSHKAKRSITNHDAKAFIINEPKSKAVIDSAVSSRKGYVPYNKNKVNQDRALVAMNLNKDPEMCLFAVMDGHGEEGHNVSQFVMENLRGNLEKQSNLKSATEDAIKRAIPSLVADLEKTGINCNFSGTTLVFGVLVGRKLFIGNIGDSRAVMARRGKTGKLEVIPLSKDHKPDDPEESARIKAKGGRIHPIPGPPNVDCGPSRVWLAEQDLPGLAMSRSIGDNICRSIGVTFDPEVKMHEITDNDLFAIWASDGVWEFLENRQAVNIIWQDKSSLKKAAKNLIDASVKEWERQEQVIDDSTCVIVQFNQF